MRIIRRKEGRLGGHIIALYDLWAKTYVGNEFFVLPGGDDVVAKQLAAILGQFSGDPLVVGIMEDLKALCQKYGVTVNPRWRIYQAPRK